MANPPTLLMLVVAGLDRRYSWSPHMAATVQVGALVGLVLALALFAWAMISNRFFSSVVRMQVDRGHTVVSGGPYRHVRHPGYLASIAMQLLAPAALGSLWAVICRGLSGLLWILRMVLEDRTLQKELEGYREYARKVRYRLLTGIW